MSTGLLVELVVVAPSAPSIPGVVLVSGRAGEDGGVKVEGPEPKAGTYDLDATVGRRTLACRRQLVEVVDRRGAGVRIGSLR